MIRVGHVNAGQMCQKSLVNKQDRGTRSSFCSFPAAVAISEHQFMRQYHSGIPYRCSSEESETITRPVSCGQGDLWTATSTKRDDRQETVSRSAAKRRTLESTPGFFWRAVIGGSEQQARAEPREKCLLKGATLHSQSANFSVNFSTTLS